MTRTLYTILFSLLLGLQVQAQVSLLANDSIVTTFRNPQMTLSIPNGNNKVLMVAITNEYTNSLNYNVSSVTLDGHNLIKLGEESSASLTSRNEIELYYLLDSAIELVTNPILNVNYNIASLLSLQEVQYHTFFFENVDQTNPFYDLRTNNLLSGNSIVATSSVLLDNNDALFSVFNSGSNNLNLGATGSSSLIQAANTSSQSTAFAWYDASSTTNETPGFSTTTTGSRLTMIGTGIHSYQGAVLPVELTSLSVSANDQDIATVKWTTATEKNSDYFLVEKLNQHDQWITIEEVNAAGQSSTKLTYEVNDYMCDVINYYRLTQVDYDGEKTVYDVLSVEALTENAEKTNLSIYPNPAVDFTQIAGIEALTTINVYDLNGNLVKQYFPTNEITYELDVRQLKSGTYILNQGKKTTILVVKKSIH